MTQKPTPVPVLTLTDLNIDGAHIATVLAAVRNAFAGNDTVTLCIYAHHSRPAYLLTVLELKRSTDYIEILKNMAVTGRLTAEHETFQDAFSAFMKQQNPPEKVYQNYPVHLAKFLKESLFVQMVNRELFGDISHIDFYVVTP